MTATAVQYCVSTGHKSVLLSGSSAQKCFDYIWLILGGQKDKRLRSVCSDILVIYTIYIYIMWKNIYPEFPNIFRGN